MQQFTKNFIGELSLQFYIFQVIVILALILYGFFLVLLMRGRSLRTFDMILAYPISLLMYSISGFFLLSFGISFNRYSLIVMLLLFLAIISVLYRDNLLDLLKNSKYIKNRNIVIFLSVAFILTLICTSGIIPVSLTNDSMYFFSEYPRALIYYGKLNAFLDNFLTDASQGVAVIGTIPFFFGFDEAFGVQALFNLNFIIFFIYSIYEYASKRIDKRRTLLITALAVLLLISSMPFVIMSRWFMANMFFMEYMAIVVYTAYKYSGTENRSDIILLGILITGLSLMRMEGALNVGVIVLCIMMLEYKNKDIAVFFVSPVLVLQAMYLVRVFVIITLHAGVTFMTKEKAAILIAFLIAIIVYTMTVRKRLFVKLEKYYPWILTGGIAAVNLLILVFDRVNYVTNIKAFAANVLRNSGWGLFVPVIIGVLLLIPKKSFRMNYFDYSVICYILVTFIAGWARGDSLYASFGDSGNRILIQVVPLLIMAVTYKIIEGIEFWKKEK